MSAASQAMKSESVYGGLLRRYLWLILFWNPIINVGVVLIFYPQHEVLRSYLTSICISLVVCTFCFGFVLLVRAIEDGFARARGRTARAHGPGWYLALSMFAMPAGLYLAFGVVGRVLDFPGPVRFADYRFGLSLGFGIAGVFFLWQEQGRARDAARVAALRVQEVEKSELAAQLAALTAHVNPHFLFNALNTVAALIKTQPDAAEETVVRLAELYRGVLSATRSTKHALAEELRLCVAYLDVERARFGERLRVEVQVADGLDPDAVLVSVLLLQPLVENAVKHGLSDRARGGTVYIFAAYEGDELELRVEDDGVGLGASKHAGAGTGIELTRRRLALSHDGRASLELLARTEGGTRAVLRLPREPGRSAA